MPMTPLAVLGLPLHILVGALLIAGSFPVLLWSVGGRRAERPVARLGGGAVDLRASSLQRGTSDRLVAPALQAVGDRLRRFTPTGLLGNLEHKLVLAGRPPSGVERLLGWKLLGGLAGLAFGLYLVPFTGGLVATLAPMLLPVVGFMYPDVRLSSQAERRQEALQLAMPQALDQVTISVEAGLGFDGALMRYADKASGPLSEEFLRSIQDIRLGSTRREAFAMLLERTDSPDLRQFVLAITQGERHGLPMAQILRSQAAELRRKRRQRAEQKAATIPVKVIFPMVVCILPVLFIVILGPAAFQIMDNLGG